jgi:hypothetical protein
MERALRPTLFLAVLLLAACLRVVGLTWGLNSGYGHERNFQPDEFVSLRGVLQLDLLAGHIKAPGAYFEGTFNYYLWAVPQALLNLLGKTDAHPSVSKDAEDLSDLLYICRWMSVLFDLCTIVVVFLAIREGTERFYPSLVGALCYAILPMQVIYAHFMRPHILSNLLCGLVIWLSLKLRKSQPWYLLLLVGVVSGLGAATRYPLGMIMVIPALYLLFRSDDNLQNSSVRLARRTKDLIAGQLWLICLGFVIGLFLGHPMLFLNLSSVTNAITGETLRYASLNQFSGSQIVNLGVVWRYIIYLIPFAMYPMLWLVPYCAIVYLLFKRNLYGLSIPILIFSALYLYVMGKGYLGPYFARITMLLFPGFCVLIGIAWSGLQLQLRNTPALNVTLTAAFLLLVGASVSFDIAYTGAMQQKDAREALRQDLQRLIGEAPAKIGVSRLGFYFYTSMPAAEPLKSHRVKVQLQDPGEKADFFVLGFPRQMDAAYMEASIRAVEAQGQFKFERSYSVPITIFGYEFRLERFPPDMTYPFPTILLFRARTPAGV